MTCAYGGERRSSAPPGPKDLGHPTMDQRKRRIIPAFLGATALALLAHRYDIGQLIADEPPGAATVATVNGAPIVRADIQPSQEAIERRFEQVYERSSRAGENSRSLTQIALELEKSALANRIRVLIRSAQLQRLGIAVSAEEIDERWRKSTQGTDVDAKLGVWNQTLSILVDSLQDACVPGADTDAIYAERLDGRMPKAQWDMHVKHDCAPDRRRVLAAYSSKGGARREEYPDILESLITTEKTRAAIDRQLIESDAEYAEYITLLNTNPKDERVQAKPPGFRDAKHQQWWQARYREAQVEIKEDLFKDAWPPGTQK